MGLINSRNLKDLVPEVAELANKFIKLCKKENIDILITSTLRNNESQDALYAQGRTTPGKIVTNAKGGQSYHNYGVAFDFVPMVNGKAQWSDSALFERCGKIGEYVGLEWAGRWVKFKEMAHFQFTNGKTLKDFQNE